MNAAQAAAEAARLTEATTADLAAHGWPCLCGEGPEDHVDGEPLPEDCPGQYEPDRSRVCTGCGGTGDGPFTWTHGATECPTCLGRGWL